MSEAMINTDGNKCTGCNKCIMVCPVKYVNNVKIIDGKRKIQVDSKRCIACGKCIKVCDHGARSYISDSERFWRDLSNEEKITVIVAPSFVANEYDRYKHFFGYLKNLGINLIYDVSFGADITVWAYTKYIKENRNNFDFLISQPCSSIVNYIEKYTPNIIKNLIPIQSPAINTAIYLKKHLGIKDKIAFLSPCIAKKTEFEKSYTHGLIDYNVTFEKICDHIKEKNINISHFPEVDFDNTQAGLGVLFSKPGGLKEGLLYHIPDLRVKQIEGTEKTYEYLNFLNSGKRLNGYDFVDIMSCKDGCNIGIAGCRKGIDPELSSEFQDEIFNDKRLKNQAKREIDLLKYKKIFQYFDETLNAEDFTLSYIPESHQLDILEPTEEGLEEAYNLLEKHDEDSRKINCYACGYKTCKDMAIALYNGYNVPSSCYQYNIKELEIQKKRLEESEAYIKMVLEHVSESVPTKDEHGIIHYY